MVIDENPVLPIPKAHEPERIIGTFSDQQVCTVLEQIDARTFPGLRNRALILLLLDTGLRLTEALNLRLADLDVPQGKARVVGKGDREAFVGLSIRLCQELGRYLRARRAALANIGRDDSPWVFPNDRGNRLGSRAVQEEFRPYGERAGIRGVRCSPHTLRHYFAVTLWRNGADLLTVSKALRHTQVQTTQRYLASLGIEDVLVRTRELSPLNTLDLPPLMEKRIRGAGGNGRGSGGSASREGLTHAASSESLCRRVRNSGGT